MKLLVEIRDHLKPGMVVVTSGDGSLISRVVRWATGSPWTHCFFMISHSEAVEAWFPNGVRMIDAWDRIARVLAEGRSHIVLDYPGLDDVDRELLAEDAQYAIGTGYSWWSAVWYLLTQRFPLWRGPHRLICTSLVTAIYSDAIGVELSPHQWLTPGQLVTETGLEVAGAGGDQLEELEEFEDARPYFAILEYLD